jgi:hypothetical protein
MAAVHQLSQTESLLNRFAIKNAMLPTPFPIVCEVIDQEKKRKEKKMKSETLSFERTMERTLPCAGIPFGLNVGKLRTKNNGVMTCGQSIRARGLTNRNIIHPGQRSVCAEISF